MHRLNKLATFALLVACVLAATPALAADGVVNINEASATQLAQLPRVGPALAGRILEFREENGKFEATQDLMLVRGIGEKTFQLMESYVVVEGKTTLNEKVSVSSAQSRLEGEDGGELSYPVRRTTARRTLLLTQRMPSCQTPTTAPGRRCSKSTSKTSSPSSSPNPPRHRLATWLRESRQGVRTSRPRR